MPIQIQRSYMSRVTNMTKEQWDSWRGVFGAVKEARANHSDAISIEQLATAIVAALVDGPEREALHKELGEHV